MKKYEIMAIIVNDLDEKAAQKYIADTLVGKIKEFEGKITFEDFWGSRGFAYRIKKYTWGYYYVAQFEMDPQKTKELRSDLNIENNILRHMITSVDPKDPEPKKYADLKKEYEAAEKAKEKDTPKEEAPKTQADREKLTTVKSQESEDRSQESEKTKEEPKKEAKSQEPKAKSQKEETPKDDLDKAIDNVLEDMTTDL